MEIIDNFHVEKVIILCFNVLNTQIPR